MGYDLDILRKIGSETIVKTLDYVRAEITKNAESAFGMVSIGDRQHESRRKLVGPTTSGKTTITLALLGHGYTPFCDDVVPIDLKERSIWRFSTARTIRPYTRFMFSSKEFDGNSIDDAYSDALKLPVRAIFFLDPTIGAARATRDISGLWERWDIVLNQTEQSDSRRLGEFPKR